jgi:small ligand-binding sensory domain FIST
MDSFSADIILNVLSFLSLKDLNRLSQASPRYFYLVFNYRRLRGPEIVAVSSKTAQVRTRQKAPDQLVQEAISKLQSTPNLALAFTSPRNQGLVQKLSCALPNETTITLHAQASSIQTCVEGFVECQSHSSLMLASLPSARFHSFCLEGDLDLLNEEVGKFHMLLRDLRNSMEEWKVFLVYACGAGSNEVEGFVTHLQACFPRSTIIGGVCSQGSITVPVSSLLPESTEAQMDEYLKSMAGSDLSQFLRELGVPDARLGSTKAELARLVMKTIATKENCLHKVEDGIFGVALGGEVPVRSVVSRGVKSLTRSLAHEADFQGLGTRTCLVVDEEELRQPGAADYMLRFANPVDSAPYRVVRSVMDVDSGKKMSPAQLNSKYGSSDYIGIQRQGEDGFELLMPHYLSNTINSFLFVGQTGDFSWKGARLDLFDLDGYECKNDLLTKMRQLRDATAGEQVMAAVMFSCNGRGPEAGSLISEPMLDASQFSVGFPTTPLLGFYALGEIGPRALAERQTVFQVGDATLQGYTAVFAVFVAPVIDVGSLNLDDRAENVRALVRDHFARS